MITIICTIITALATILCAWIAAQGVKADKARKARDGVMDQRAEERAKEARLQLAMIAANSELTVGVAMALKRGHCNGEVEAGLQAVEKANKDYMKFLEGIAITHMNQGGN